MTQSNSDSTTRAHLFIKGVVQGVGYRFSTLDQAQALHLQGWVRNLPDGRVEAVIEGKSSIVEKMITWCRRGPRGAKVDEVLVEYETIKGERGFEIRR